MFIPAPGAIGTILAPEAGLEGGLPLVSVVTQPPYLVRMVHGHLGRRQTAIRARVPLHF